MAERESFQALGLDQRQRWLQGERLRVEDYLQKHPDLRDHPEELLDLIYNEILLRDEMGHAPRLDEYLRRFGEFEQQIRQLFEVHEVLEHEGLSQTTMIASQTEARPQEGMRTDFLSGYEIVRELGRGGMGVVYEARHKALNRLVALKMILAGVHASPRHLARFRTEAEAVARLQHPHIVQIYDIHEGEQPCIALELVTGGSLAQKLANTPQPPRNTAELIRTLAQAVHYAHQHGIVHRDLKPSNVLLGADDAPKITDFGLAKLLDVDSEHTPTEAFMGTPNYMSPEQASGKAREIGPVADVYALGAICYEMLTGRPPFRGATMLETIEQVRSQEPVPPRRLVPRVPADLETICLKCLEKEPARRYATAEALAEDLRRFLADEPILARRSSAWHRLAKWSRRRPASAALLAVAIIVLMAVTIVITSSRIHENERLARLRDEAMDITRLGQAAFTSQDWQQAAYQLQRALDRMSTEPSLNDLRTQVEMMQSQAQSQLSIQTSRRHAEEAYGRFRELYDRAIFHALAADLAITGLDTKENRKAATAAAGEALALVELSPKPGTSWSPGTGLTAAQRMEIKNNAYTLLLVLAETAGKTDRSGLQEALSLLDRAAEIGAPTRAGWQRRAVYLDRLGRSADAARARQQAQDQVPARALDFFLIGVERLLQTKLDQAITALEDAVTAQPNHFWARCSLAFCYLPKGEWDRARAELTFCIGQRPDSVWPYLLRGFAYQQMGNFARADADFQRAQALLERFPNAHAHYVLLVNRGVLRFRQDRLDDAAHDLQRAMQLQPSEWIVHLNLGHVYQKQHRLQEAKAEMDRAVELKAPAKLIADMHADDARQLYLQGKYDEATSACALALAKQSDNIEALGVLAQTSLKLRRFEPAIRAFDRYFTLDGKRTVEMHIGRGSARMQGGAFLAAVDDYTAALNLHPTAELWAHRGWAYFFADAFKPAERDFTNALKLQPENSAAYVGRGLARVMVGQYREAVQDADEAWRRKISDPEMTHNLACIFAQAVAKVDADPREADRKTLTVRYRTRAVAIIQAALELVPASERNAFWQTKILPDTALDPIRSFPDFQGLAKSVTRPEVQQKK
jgi:serine/threonine protein kinase/Flp pilus assembly protein TadD